MKKIYTLLILSLLTILGLGRAQAQVIDVCAGNDTVELRLGNFQYGYVQWQVSEDNEVWSDIDGAIDTVYRFLPERPQYYRAEVRFPACSEYNYHSQVSYVQLPPKAFAGPDLTIPAGMVARMNATRVEGAEGDWNIMEGVGGTLENPNDCHSGFIGEEGEYKLTWTVTNSCGSNTDTVTIKCVRMEYQTDLVIVDETDAILSDSTQRLNGEYIISFNDPVPDIQVGSVLMGYMYPSFLRKVVSFEREGNLFIMQTEQGVLTDVIAAGAININLTADSINGRKPHVKYLDRFPTRKELKENPFLLRDGSVYVIKSVSNEKAIDDFEFDVEMTTEGFLSFKLFEFDFKKLSNKLDGLKYSSEIKIYPNFNANIVFENLEFKEARIGFYDARVEHIQRINLRKPLSTTLVEKEGYFNKTQILLGGFMIGYIPTLVVLDFPYVFKVQASLNPPMSFTKVTGNTYTYEMYYTPEMTVPTLRKGKGEPYQHTSYETPVGSLDASFRTGFKASVLLLDLLGPYFEATGDFNPSICASSETGDVGGNINMGVNLNLGCRFQLFSNQLTLFDIKTPDLRVVDYNEPAPKRVVKFRGDNQVYSFGQYLTVPVGVRVDGWFNTPMPLAYVHFDPEHGSVSDSIVFTDIYGVAETRWKPGVQYGMDKLRVKVYDCYGNLAGETPQTFRAYSSATDPCLNANLTVEAYEVNENTIIPQVSGGRKPYRYSTDGENYSTTQPTIHTQSGHNYHLCVRDANGCEADTWYNSPFYDCNNTTLQVNAMVVGNSVTVSGRGGIEPYQYSIGGDFQPSGLFGSLYDGEYTVTVRDALGCESSQHVFIYRPGNLGISITEITNGSGNAMVMTQTNSLIDRGVCWSTHHAPTVQDLHNSYGPGGGFYTFTITALDPDKTYYVRAYALDGSGTSYSREVCINSANVGNLPVVAATGITNVSPTSAIGSGNITSDGGYEITERGICWSLIHNPTVGEAHVSCGSGTGAFSGNLTNLSPLFHYYVRAYACNAAGTAYGNEVEFTTPQNGGGGGDTHEYVDLGLPSGLLWAICNIGANSPEEYGDYFAWGETEPKNVYSWSTYQYCRGSSSTLTKYCYDSSYGYNGFTDNLTTLLPEDDAATANWGAGCRMPTREEWQELRDNTTSAWTTQNGVNGRLFIAPNGNSLFLPAAGYRWDDELDNAGDYGSYWSSSLSTLYPYIAWDLRFHSGSTGEGSYNRSYGHQVRPVRSASPSGQSPQVTTSEITNITSSTATCGGDVVSDGGTAVTERGVCWSTNLNPTLNDQHSSAGAGVGAFVVNVTGLAPSTTYYVRAYATNAVGTAYGNVVSFTTSGGGSGNHEYVDLGLPSGTLWATCNVGANSPEEYGDYFAWGETQSKDNYSWNNYRYCMGSENTLTKYCNNSNYGYNGFIDNLLSLLLEDDAVTVNWGNDWRMPTKEEWVELLQNTTNTWTIQNGVRGRLFAASNGNSIFLPTAGICWDDEYIGVGIRGDYLSKLVYADDPRSAWSLYLDSGGCTIHHDRYRYPGFSVRPVRSQASGNVPEGAINGQFSVSPTRQVYFSQGNLQYQASTNTWRFAEHQWDFVGGTDDQNVHYGNVAGSSNNDISATYSGWIDLFGYATSGWNNGNANYHPWDYQVDNTLYGGGYGPLDGSDLSGTYANSDWGVYNPISNGGNIAGLWRTLTKDEWDYVFFTRNTASSIRYAMAKVGGVNGVILLPDNWSTAIYSLNLPNTSEAGYSSNTISVSQWMNVFEAVGAVFFPAVGQRNSGSRDYRYSVDNLFGVGQYWSTTTVFCFGFWESYLYTSEANPRAGFSVRLVRDVE